VLLDGQRKELMALNEALAKLQERNTRLEAENHTIHADLNAQKENGNREARELNIAINELKSQHENERHYLNDNLSQVCSLPHIKLFINLISYLKILFF
jgi:chromosome segregation ATPase